MYCTIDEIAENCRDAEEKRNVSGIARNVYLECCDISAHTLKSGGEAKISEFSQAYLLGFFKSVSA